MKYPEPAARRTARLLLTALEPRDNPASAFLASGAAAGGLPLVEVANPDGGALARFPAYDLSFRGGVRAAAAELDGDLGTVEVITAPGVGGGPNLKVFQVSLANQQVTEVDSIFAMDPNYRGGLRVAAVRPPGGGAVDHVVVGADVTGGPRVQILQLAGTDLIPTTGPLADFFAFEESFRGGVRVGAGELDGNLGDGDELIVAAGEGGAPRVKVLRADGAVLADFFTFRPDFAGGVNVGVTPAAGGLVGTPVIDALADDFSQRNSSLNAATRVQTAQTNTGFGQNVGVNSLGQFAGSTDAPLLGAASGSFGQNGSTAAGTTATGVAGNTVTGTTVNGTVGTGAGVGTGVGTGGVGLPGVGTNGIPVAGNGATGLANGGLGVTGFDTAVTGTTGFGSQFGSAFGSPFGSSFGSSFGSAFGSPAVAGLSTVGTVGNGVTGTTGTLGTGFSGFTSGPTGTVPGGLGSATGAATSGFGSTIGPIGTAGLGFPVSAGTGFNTGNGLGLTGTGTAVNSFGNPGPVFTFPPLATLPFAGPLTSLNTLVG